MFLSEVNNIQILSSIHLDFIKTFKPSYNRYGIVKDNVEIFIELSEQLTYEFKWKLFVVVLDFEKRKKDNKPPEDLLVHFMDLLKNKKYKEFLCDYNKYNGKLEHGYVFNKTLLNYARIKRADSEIIDFLKTFDNDKFMSIN